jgi:hypothetical protein
MKRALLQISGIQDRLFDPSRPLGWLFSALRMIRLACCFVICCHRLESIHTNSIPASTPLKAPIWKGPKSRGAGTPAVT